MMTTSGFISPAREGKLPDSKAPIIPSDYIKPIVKETPPSTVVGTVASSSIPISNLPEKKIKKKAPSSNEKPRKKDKVSKELFNQTKVTPMGPPPPKQMPPLATPIFPPSNSPMATVVEQQIKKKTKKLNPAGPKPLKKHKHKDPNKISLKNADGKISKKRKKMLDRKMIEKSWDMSLMGIDPLTNKQFLSMAGNELQIKHERPHTPDIALDMLKQEPGIEHPQMITQFQYPDGSIGPVIPQASLPHSLASTSAFEGKIASEPDKKKLNIIKRISSKNKDEIAKNALLPHLNLPETSIYPIDDKSMVLNPAAMAHIKKSNYSPKKQQNAMRNNDMPLNMTMPKPFMDPEIAAMSEGMFSKSPIQQRLSPYEVHKALNAKGTPKKEPKPKKIREKKPAKLKEKKIKQANEWPKNIIPDLITSVVPPPKAAAPPRKPAHLPPTLGNMDLPLFDQFNPINPAAMAAAAANGFQNFMYPWPFPNAAPGLIPNHSLFPTFHPMAFGMQPNIDFQRMKRPRHDVNDDVPSIPIEEVKPQCNVAPLVPASLKLEDMNVSHTKSNRSSIEYVKETSSAKFTPLPPTHSADQHFSQTNSTQISDKQSYNEDTHKPSRPNIPPSFLDHASPMASSKRRRSISSSPPPRTTSSTEDTTSSMHATINLDDSSDAPTSSYKDKSATKPDKQRKDKEHKKEKKDKEGKLKKKKDKKDKQKNKEKSEKRKEKEEKKRDKELKEKTKKEKREKKKEKERAAAAAAAAMGGGQSILGMLDLGGNDSNISSPRSTIDSDGSIPKLTLKLGGGSGAASPRPITPDVHRKL